MFSPNYPGRRDLRPRGLREYLYNGRCNRKGFWGLFGGFLIGAVIFGAIASQVRLGWLALLLIGPGPLILGVAVARLHDLGRTGWWALTPLVAAFALSNTLGALLHLYVLAGGLIVLVTLGCLAVLGAAPGNPGPNRFGPPPGVKAFG